MGFKWIFFAPNVCSLRCWHWHCYCCALASTRSHRFAVFLSLWIFFVYFFFFFLCLLFRSFCFFLPWMTVSSNYANLSANHEGIKNWSEILRNWSTIKRNILRNLVIAALLMYDYMNQEILACVAPFRFSSSIASLHT